MIRYALACEAGHTFESWFSDSAAYEQLQAKGLVQCAVCGSGKVERQIMSPAVARRDRDSGSVSPQAEAGPGLAGQGLAGQGLAGKGEILSPGASVAMTPGGDGEVARAIREKIRELHAYVRANSEDVGENFASEARAIHEGEMPERAISGRASLDEARALIEDGIGVMPLPPLPDEQN
jgi:hypothetical protein